MDISKLDIGIKKPRAATVTTVTAELKDRDGNPFLNGNGKPLTVDLLPLNTPEGGKAYRKWRLKFGALDASEMRLDLDEDDLDRLADIDAQSGLELAARLTAGWNLETKDGKAVPASLEYKMEFYSTFEPVVLAVTDEITKAAETLGNSKRGSVSGPRKPVS